MASDGGTTQAAAAATGTAPAAVSATDAPPPAWRKLALLGTALTVIAGLIAAPFIDRMMEERTAHAVVEEYLTAIASGDGARALDLVPISPRDIDPRLGEEAIEEMALNLSNATERIQLQHIEIIDTPSQALVDYSLAGTTYRAALGLARDGSGESYRITSPLIDELQITRKVLYDATLGSVSLGTGFDPGPTGNLDIEAGAFTNQIPVFPGVYPVSSTPSSHLVQQQSSVTAPAGIPLKSWSGDEAPTRARTEIHFADVLGTDVSASIEAALDAQLTSCVNERRYDDTDCLVRHLHINAEDSVTVDGHHIVRAVTGARAAITFPSLVHHYELPTGEEGSDRYENGEDDHCWFRLDGESILLNEACTDGM